MQTARWNLTYVGVAGALIVLTAISAGSQAAAFEDTIILPGTRAFPESITASKDGTLYIGSLADGGIMRAFPGSKVAEPWIKPAVFGTASILGVLADDPSQTLWVCSNDMSAQGVTVTGASPGSALRVSVDATATARQCWHTV